MWADSPQGRLTRVRLGVAPALRRLLSVAAEDHFQAELLHLQASLGSVLWPMATCVLGSSTSFSFSNFSSPRAARPPRKRESRVHGASSGRFSDSPGLGTSAARIPGGAGAGAGNVARRSLGRRGGSSGRGGRGREGRRRAVEQYRRGLPTSQRLRPEASWAQEVGSETRGAESRTISLSEKVAGGWRSGRDGGDWSET